MDKNPLLGFVTDIQRIEADATQLRTSVISPEGPVYPTVHNRAPHSTQIPIPHDNYVDLSLKYEDEDPRHVILENKPVSHPITTMGEPMVDDKYKTLEERLRVVEGFNIFGVDAMEIFLVPDVVIPLKFKAHEFEKYKGASFPRGHP